MDWVGLHERIRFARANYIDELKTENDLTARIGVLSLMHHRMVRNAKYLSGWVHYLRTGRPVAMDRNEWNHSDSELMSPASTTSASAAAAAASAGAGMPASATAAAVAPASEVSLDRADSFLRMLRSRPDALAVMALTALDPITNKLKSMLGTNSDKYIFSELVCFSLFGSAAARDDISTGFRAFFRALLLAEFRYESSPVFVKVSREYSPAFNPTAALPTAGVGFSSGAAAIPSSLAPTKSPLANANASSAATGGGGGLVVGSLPAHIAAQHVTFDSLNGTRDPFARPQSPPVSGAGGSAGGTAIATPVAVKPQRVEPITSVTHRLRLPVCPLPADVFVLCRCAVSWMRRFASDFVSKMFKAPMRVLLQEDVYFVDPERSMDATTGAALAAAAAAASGSSAGTGSGDSKTTPSLLTKTRTGLFDKKPATTPSPASDRFASSPGVSSNAAASSPAPAPAAASAPRTVRQKVLKRIVDGFVSKLIVASQRFPWQALHVVADVLSFSAAQWSNALYAEQRHSLVASLLFVQFVLPALRKPAVSGLLEIGVALNRKQRANVTVVVSIVQQILLAASVGSSPAPAPFPDSHYLAPLNSYILEHARRVRTSIELLTSSIESIPMPATVTLAGADPSTRERVTGGLPPALSYAGTICLTRTETIFLHRLLFQPSATTAVNALINKAEVLAFANIPLAGAVRSAADDGSSGGSSGGSDAGAASAAAAASSGGNRHFVFSVVDDRDRVQPSFPDTEKRICKLLTSRYIQSWADAASVAIVPSAIAATTTAAAGTAQSKPASMPALDPSPSPSFGTPPTPVSVVGLSSADRPASFDVKADNSPKAASAPAIDRKSDGGPSAGVGAVAAPLSNTRSSGVPALSARRQRMVRLLELIGSLFVGTDIELSIDAPAARSPAGALRAVLKHMRHQLDVRVDYEFEHTAHLLCVLQEVEESLASIIDSITGTGAAANNTPHSHPRSHALTPTAAGSDSASGKAPPPPIAASFSGSRNRSNSPLFAPAASTADGADDAVARFMHSLFEHVSSALSVFQSESGVRWAARRQHLVGIIRQCEAELDRGKRECALYNALVFQSKVVGFAKHVEITMKLQLPAAAKRVRMPAAAAALPSSSAAAASASASFLFDASTIRKSARELQQREQQSAAASGPPQFWCSSIDTFIDEYASYAPYLMSARPLAAKIYQTFLRFVNKKVTEDATFMFNESKEDDTRNRSAGPDSVTLALNDKDFALLYSLHPGTDLFAISNDILREESRHNATAVNSAAAGGGAGSSANGSRGPVHAPRLPAQQRPSVAANAHVERAVSLLDRALCARLFSVMFPNDRSAESFEDERLTWKLKGLKPWLEPRHLLIAQIPSHVKVWDRILRAIQRMDTYHSPRERLACMTSAIKWCGKMLSVRCKGGSSGVDADTSLSALIFAIVQAQPQRLCSSLAYIETFLTNEQLMGQDGYCLTQFSLAVSYISDSLGDLTREQMEQQLIAQQQPQSQQPQPQSAQAPQTPTPAAAAAAAVAVTASPVTNPKSPVSPALTPATPAGGHKADSKLDPTNPAPAKGIAAPVITLTTPPVASAVAAPATASSKPPRAASTAVPSAYAAAVEASGKTSEVISNLLTAPAADGNRSGKPRRMPSVQVSAQALSVALYDESGQRRPRHTSAIAHVAVFQCLIREDVILVRVLSSLAVRELVAPARVCKKWRLSCTARLLSAKTKAIPKLVGAFAFGDGTDDTPPPAKSNATAKPNPNSKPASAAAGGGGGSGGAGLAPAVAPVLIPKVSSAAAFGSPVATAGRAAAKSASSPATVAGPGDASDDLDSILDDPHRANAFILYCKTTFCDEYLGFYLAVQSYKELSPGSAKQLAAAHGLNERFIRTEAEQEVSFPQPLRDRIALVIAANPISGASAATAASASAGKSTGNQKSKEDTTLNPSTFDILQRYVLNQMRVDILPKFLGHLAKKREMFGQSAKPNTK